MEDEVEKAMESAMARIPSVTLKPTIVTVDEGILRQAHGVCEDVMEWASELLAIHDRALGRTTKKNKVIAEMYERDWRRASDCRNKIRQSLGWKTNAEQQNESQK